MEMSLKKDVLRELRAGDGRLLLHDEVEERPGQFDIVPIWETVEEDDIMTPRDVFDEMKAEGYKVCALQINLSVLLFTGFALYRSTMIALLLRTNKRHFQMRSGSSLRGSVQVLLLQVTLCSIARWAEDEQQLGW
jgi:hypothetical protein